MLYLIGLIKFRRLFLKVSKLFCFSDAMIYQVTDLVTVDGGKGFLRSFDYSLIWVICLNFW